MFKEKGILVIFVFIDFREIKGEKKELKGFMRSNIIKKIDLKFYVILIIFF